MNFKNLFSYFIIFLSFLCVTNCEKDSSENPHINVKTSAIIEITYNSAVSGGNVYYDGGKSINVRGICWHTSSNPTTENEHTMDGSGTGSFSSNIQGLDLNTKYYVRAYAINDKETAYGYELIFTTKDGLPDSIATSEVSHITTSTALCGGNILDDGGFTITERGVCWSTNPNPTIDDAHTNNVGGTGKFICELDGLTKQTIYYVRAYSVNTNGIAYGNELSFRTINNAIDYDGNIYKTIKIGNQIWMAENLKVTHYSNGTPITLVEDSATWSNFSDSDKAFCYYNNNISNADTYGALYTWAAIMDENKSSNANPSEIQGACPDGWHLPSDSEWKELEIYLGMSQSTADATGWRGTNQGCKLADCSDLWVDGDLENNDQFGTSGFTALPGGFRYNNGVYEMFYLLGGVTHFWSSTENNNTNAWQRSIYYYYTDVRRSDSSKKHGYSVRCLQD